MMPFQLFALAELGFNGRSPRPEAEFLNGGWACYRPYRLGDGAEVALGAIEPQFWSAFCRASQRPDWLTRHADPLPQRALISEVEAHFAGLSAAECERRYESADCCLTRVRNLAEAVDSDFMRDRGLVRPHPAMRIFEAAYPVLIDGQRPALRTPLVEELEASEQG